jgi:predicted alpha/beta hydrolase family esterase
MEKEAIDEETVLIAHSLGTQFVPKYLAEKEQKIDTYISVAGYLRYKGRSDLEEVNRSFEPSAADFEKCRRLISRRISLYSDHDRMNPVEKLEAYAEALAAEKVLIPGAGHFDPASGMTVLPLPQNVFNT